MTIVSPIRKIAQLMACGAHDDALAMIEAVVDRIFCEPLNVGKVFGSPELDRFCQDIGAASLERLGGGLLPPADNGGDAIVKGTIVYLVSKLQPSGGHTAALIDITRLSPLSRTIVIVTGTCGRTNRDVVKQKFDGLQHVILEYVPAGSHISKLEWIQRRLAELSPDTVWLFNHHQDSVAIAAVQPELGYRVRFYHHGDHHLCLGVHLAYAEHIDPHPMGYHNCREHVGIQHNHYLPLVAHDYGDRPAELGFHNGKGLVTCTAGSFNKLEVPYFVHYTDLVPEMLRATGGCHIHLGKLTPLALWRIRRGLCRYGIAPGAFVYIPYVPSVWCVLHEFAVDVYVASFPYGGGRTLVEVMGAGVPAVLHSHCTNRMLGGFDMAYEGALIWREPEELLAHLQKVDRLTLGQESRLARRWYEKYHSEEILRRYLDDKQSQTDVPALRAGYRADAFVLALQTSQKVMIRGLLRRMIWRYYRRWQALLGRLM